MKISDLYGVAEYDYYFNELIVNIGPNSIFFFVGCIYLLINKKYDII